MTGQHIPELTPKRILTRSMALVIAACVAVATFVVFKPALDNDFVDYDDPRNFLENEAYRGLGAEQLQWMWTPQKPLFMGHYHPLTWMTLGFDYTNWEMDPRGYHLTSNVIHAVNAGLFFLLALRLLRWHRRGEPVLLDLIAATSAALFWAVHPLRVESVAWITERRDLVNGCFALLAVLAYVRAMRPEQTRWPYLGWLLTAWLLFIASLLGKAMTVTLPAVLLVLDWYPLRRFGREWHRQAALDSPVRSATAGKIARRGQHQAAANATAKSAKWFGRETWHVLLEKVPFFAVSLFFVLFAAGGQAGGGWMLSLKQHGVFERITVCTYGLAFYVWKTIVPIALLPIYEIHLPFNPFQLRFALAAAFVLAALAALWLVRKRLPAAITAALCYCIILSPVLGAAQNGLQLVADRYSYLAVMPLMFLAGGGIIAIGRTWNLKAHVLMPISAIVILVLSVLTWRQCLVWRSTESLWTHTIELDPAGSYANNSYGYVLRTQNKIEESVEFFRKAIKIQPNFNREAYINLWSSLSDLGLRDDELIPEWRIGMDVPGVADVAHYLYGRACLTRPAGLESQRRADAQEAVEHSQKAIESRAAILMRPYPEARSNLALALTRLGRLDEAEQQYRQAIQEDSNLIPARYGLAVVLMRLGKRTEAIEELRVMLRMSPTHADGRRLLDQLLSG